MTNDQLAPVLSVIVPTYNRHDRLRRVLSALAGQTSTSPFEVVVVSDGSTDGTDSYLASGATPLPVVAVTQENAGPAAARNRGVQTARGDLVLFLDDDVVPAPDLVEQHLRAHDASADDIVVIGPMLSPDDASFSPWVAWEQHQLYKQYEAMRTGLFQCTFHQFYTGNASVSRQRVIDVGQFDTDLRRAEDVELAFRLHQVGVGFEFRPEARGFHYAERSFESWLRTAFEYGRNDARFIREGQSWLGVSLPAEFSDRHPLVRVLTRYCVPRPRAARIAAAVLRRVGSSGTPLGPLRRQALSGLYNLSYYQGLASSLGSAERFLAFLERREAHDQRPRAAFVLEQTLGHVTHSQNLRRLLADNGRVQPVFLEVPYDVTGYAAKVPGMSNWTVRAGLRARQAIRREWRRGPIDVMFIHTQVPAVLVGRWMRRIPTVVSLDATPVQYDELGEQYSHEKSSPPAEAAKKWLNARCFRSARHVITWSAWARGSLVRDYGVPQDRITVIAPGVDVARWQRTSRPAPASPVRVLFVGGDFERKGGHLLVEAARRLREEGSVPAFELHLVTKTPIEAAPGIVVHDDLKPNSHELVALYHSSHVFCLPTLGDCLALVLMEAGIAELAVIATDVGAISEFVRHDETGLLIPPGDVAALTEALRLLLDDPDRRARLGTSAAELVRREFDAAVNADRLAALMVGLTPVRGSR